MEFYEIISYALNIIFVTWGSTVFFKDRRRDRETANFLIAAYDMANRLSGSLADKHAKQQAENIGSFLKSAIMNFRNMKRNEITRKKRTSWLRKISRSK